LGTSLPQNYTSSLYEVGGVLYQIHVYSIQQPQNWHFYHASIFKSTDGGANWTNPLGQVNTVMPDTIADSSFPDAKWSEVKFVKYGQGGAAPNIDNAQSYVYFYTEDDGIWDNYYMARMLRTDLPSLDKTKIQYFTGGDGSLSANWSSSITAAVPIISATNRASVTSSMEYDYGLDRYIMVDMGYQGVLDPGFEQSARILEAPHPWGPWTVLLEQNENNEAGGGANWPFLMQKYASTDGQKVWMDYQGTQYGLSFMPLYLTSQPVQTLEAESAALTGTSTASSVAGYTGSGYVTSFDTVGDKSQFNATVSSTGAYILKFRYNTAADKTISLYVNGVKKQQLLLGNSTQTTLGLTWQDITAFAWLTSGSNTVTVQYDSGDSGNLNLDSLKLALYSTVEFPCL